MIEKIKKIDKKSAVFVVVLIMILFLISGRGAEKTAKQYVKATLNEDAGKFVSLMTDEQQEVIKKRENIHTKKLLVYEIKTLLESKHDSYVRKYGDEWKYKIKVIDSYECPIEIKKQYADNILGRKSKIVTVEIHHKGTEKLFGLLPGDEVTEAWDILVVKDGRKWKVASIDDFGHLGSSSDYYDTW